LNAARTHYGRVIADSPKNQPPTDEALYRLGGIMQLEGKWREADEYFDKLMHNFPNTALAKRAASRVRAVRWSIQVGAYSSDRSGRQLEAVLRQEGFSPREERELRDGQVLRLMRVGNYPTFDAAKPDLLRVQRHRSDAFITPAR
jgi:tetratricopeptide (TPR) repeat protein